MDPRISSLIAYSVADGDPNKERQKEISIKLQICFVYAVNYSSQDKRKLTGQTFKKSKTCQENCNQCISNRRS